MIDKGQKVLVQVDTKDEEVIQWDQEGKLLEFRTVPGKFRYLDSEVLKGLKKINRDRYSVYLDVMEDLSEQGEDEIANSVSEVFQIDNQSGTATDKLAVQRNDQNEFVHRWERPDKVNVRLGQGWEVVKGRYETLRNQSGNSVHRIGEKGREELVLMRLPMEKKREHSKKKHERRRKAIGEAERRAKADIARTGAPVVDDSTPGDFRPISG